MSQLCQNPRDLNDLAQHIVTESAHKLLKGVRLLKAMESLESFAMLQKQAR